MASKRRAQQQQQNPPPPTRQTEGGVLTTTFDTCTFVFENINPLFDPKRVLQRRTFFITDTRAYICPWASTLPEIINRLWNFGEPGLRR
jgi:hypothetical protein